MAVNITYEKSSLAQLLDQLPQLLLSYKMQGMDMQFRAYQGKLNREQNTYQTLYDQRIASLDKLKEDFEEQQKTYSGYTNEMYKLPAQNQTAGTPQLQAQNLNTGLGSIQTAISDAEADIQLYEKALNEIQIRNLNLNILGEFIGGIKGPEGGIDPDAFEAIEFAEANFEKYASSLDPLNAAMIQEDYMQKGIKRMESQAEDIAKGLNKTLLEANIKELEYESNKLDFDSSRAEEQVAMIERRRDAVVSGTSTLLSSGTQYVANIFQSIIDDQMEATTLREAIATRVSEGEKVVTEGANMDPDVAKLMTLEESIYGEMEAIGAEILGHIPIFNEDGVIVENYYDEDLSSMYVSLGSNLITSNMLYNDQLADKDESPSQVQTWIENGLEPVYNWAIENLDVSKGGDFPSLASRLQELVSTGKITIDNANSYLEGYKESVKDHTGFTIEELAQDMPTILGGLKSIKDISIELMNYGTGTPAANTSQALGQNAPNTAALNSLAPLAPYTGPSLSPKKKNLKSTITSTITPNFMQAEQYTGVGMMKLEDFKFDDYLGTWLGEPLKRNDFRIHLGAIIDQKNQYRTSVDSPAFDLMEEAYEYIEKVGPFPTAEELEAENIDSSDFINRINEAHEAYVRSGHDLIVEKYEEEKTQLSTMQSDMGYYKKYFLRVFKGLSLKQWKKNEILKIEKKYPAYDWEGYKNEIIKEYEAEERAKLK